MTIENFWAFALAGLLLNLTPGNDMLYVVARSTGQGTRAGIISALGIGAGGLVHVLMAVIGLSALIAQSAVAFAIIKYIGASYLIYLGVKSLAARKRALIVHKDFQTLSRQKIFRQAALTNILNPKVALFFLAFLPQFVEPQSGQAVLQIIFLGVWFDVVGTLVNILVALLFGRMSTWLTGSPAFLRWQARITGVVLIVLGVRVALSARE